MRAYLVAASQLVLFVFSFWLVTAVSTAAANAMQDSAWSQPINGLQARLKLKREEVFNGTPIIATYLELRNVSDRMEPMTLPWDDKLLAFRVVDAKGKDVPKSAVTFSGPVLDQTIPLVIPRDGELAFNITIRGFGIPADKAAQIGFNGPANWVIESDQGECFLHAVLEVPKSAAERGGKSFPWTGRIELPPVKILTNRPPLDAAVAAARIKELGPQMLDSNGNHERAQRELSLIDDPAVVPWYIKALETDRYSLKFCAIDRLSRIDSDEAFQALKKGMSVGPNDFGKTANPSVAPALAQNIRGAAAQALARSPHRDAKPLLLTFANDGDPNIRLEVVHLLGRMDTPESLDMLKKMSTDPGDIVSSEAKRYLKRREKSGPSGSVQK